MTSTSERVRTALVRATFVEIEDLDLDTASYLLRGLDDLFLLDWMSTGPPGERLVPISELRSELASSPRLRRISYNSPLEVLLYVSGGLGVGLQAIRLFERVHQARTRKARADLFVDATKALRDMLPAHVEPDDATRTAIERAAAAVAILQSLAVVDERDV